MNKLIEILEDLKQEDYELWILTSGKCHFDEEEWDWLISEVKRKIIEKEKLNNE